jgi:hypothetical protein
VGYLERAQLIGHDVSRLKNGETIRSTVLVETLDKFKAIFAGSLTPAHRAEFSRKTGASPWAMQFNGMPDATMGRLLNYVFGDGELTPADTNFASKMFPLKIDAVSGQNITISTAEQCGPTAAPVAINADTLTFATGGSITALNTVLTVTADNLVIQTGQATAAAPYHIGLLGVTGAIGQTGSPGPNTTGQGQPGNSIQPPTAGICTGASAGGTGGTGGAGGTGGTGGTGGNGLPSLPATITIAAYSNPAASFVVFTQSGGGGQGGIGGKGGTGQQGGTGGNGCNSGCEGTNGGNGGTGGTGGQGGNGGPGGNGVAGSQITINFPAAAKALLVTNDAVAPPGPGGSPGPGGDPGSGGSPGQGGKHSSNGATGGAGSQGPQGQSAGAAGAASGASGGFSTNFTS